MVRGGGRRSGEQRVRAAPQEECAMWTRASERELIALCHTEYVNGHYLGQSFTRNTLMRITDRLNAVVGPDICYTFINIQNKLKNYRRCYRLMAEHKVKSGVGWDEVKETIIAEPDYIASIIVRSTDYAAFLAHGCPNFQLCEIMWQNTMATGEGSLSSGAGTSGTSGASVDGARRSRSHPFAFLEGTGLGPGEGTSRRCGRGSSANQEREGRVRAHASWEQYVDDRSPSGSRMTDIRAVFDEVNAMDLPVAVKLAAADALRNPVTRTMFQLFDPECKLAWLQRFAL